MQAEHEPVFSPAVIIVDSDADLAECAAREVAAVLRTRPAAVLGLPTGRTPCGLYARLAAMQRRGEIDLSRITGFLIDELIGLGADDPHSFAAFIKAHFSDPAGLAPAQVQAPDGLAADPEAEAGRYAAAIAAAGGLDLALLGIGPNGHIGLNEPGSPLTAPVRVAELAPETRARYAAQFGGEDAVPQRGITMGIGTLRAARRLVLLAAGAAKAAAVHAMLHAPISPAVPATAIRRHPAAVVIVDRAAYAAGG